MSAARAAALAASQSGLADVALLRCTGCAAEAPASSRDFECACGAPYDVEHAFRLVGRETFDARDLRSPAPHDSGVWRFLELVYPRFPSEAVISLREGNTPLLASPVLCEFVGIEQVKLKHEGLNPTGSFADRGMTVAVSRARANGARHLVCASDGAAAASLGAYAARAALPCTVLAPAAAHAPAKLAQARAFGAHVVLVRADSERVRALARELAQTEQLDLLDACNPFGIEGHKSTLFELLVQLAWRAPDWIALALENFAHCCAFAKALREARYLGLIDRLPRLLAAGSLRDPQSHGARRALSAIAETRGEVLAITPEQAALAKLAIDRAGLGCDLASAAPLAGARELARRGGIGPEESVVVVLDSHWLGAPSTSLAALPTVAAELGALRSARAD
ncbi:MAG: pyridoxal-phosphate dependent enzyme [Planctomycetes bacterium]|nr:pyridoxal-phosphate dependent enzyme [Planctomycetota bacterium]